MSTATDIDVDLLLREALEDLYAVVILDSNLTTFEDVIACLVQLCNYTLEAADALAWQVHRRGEAVASVLGKSEAEELVIKIAEFSVRAIIRPA